VHFSNLLEMVAEVNPLLRVRFSTSHPKDLNDDVLYAMQKHDNICKNIHLPVQSGSTRILDLMNRTYTREWYIERIDAIRRIIPGCTISTDIISGFCTETEEDHQETISMMNYVKYDYAYMFSYSERPGTPAAKKFADDVTPEVKSRRLTEIVQLQREHSLLQLQKQVGNIQKVLIEGLSKKSPNDFSGKSDQNYVCVFPVHKEYKKGDYVDVLIESCTSATLIGKII
jgi:tRNA-2-methylthio-N6-dimethylallyladenosine synthase